MAILEFLTGVGPMVFLPIIFTLLGLLFRQKVGKALRAGLTIGIGFAGINLVIGFFWNAVAPVVEALVGAYGFHLDIIDLGWPAAASVAWGSPIAPVIVLAVLVVNFIMLALKLTKTMNIDIWNFWGPILLGQITYHSTGKAVLGVVTAVLIMILNLILADKTQKLLFNYFKMPGVSITHVFTQNAGLIAFPVNWLIDRIPGINKININSGQIQEKYGVIGEPMIIGLIIGIVLSAIARMGLQTVLVTGVSLAASMVLLPKMVGILMEGLVPLSESAQAFMSKRFAGRELYIGMDSAIMIGDPANIATAVLLVPIALLIALVLPGNRTLPLADLPSLLYMTVIAVAITKGNIFRSVIIGIPMLCATLWTATAMAPAVTALARNIGFPIPEGLTEITSVATGYYWISYLIQEVVTRIGNLL